MARFYLLSPNQNYYIYYGTGKEPLVNISVQGFVGCMFSVGLAIGVIFAVGGLFYVQMRSILKNESGIETWIKDKAEYREREKDEPDFVFPYNLGRWENFKMVFHWTPRPELDGIWWPVVEGCHQYTLTKEQIMQKKDKKERSVRYKIRYAFSGSMCPITWGPKVCCCPPCTDEPRIKLSPGDTVVVTRWKKRWLYGDKVLGAGSTTALRRVRGWFPRKCAIEPYEDEGSTENQDDNKNITNNSMESTGDAQSSENSNSKKIN